MSKAEDTERRMCHARALADMFTGLMPEGLRLEWERQEPLNLYDANLPQWPVPPCEPVRNLFFPVRYLRELAEQRRTEESGRKAWLREVKQRLGLVHAGEPLHRCTVERGLFRWEQSWGWSCRVPRCASFTGYGSQAEAFADAFEHAAGRLDVHANPWVPGALVIDRRGGAA